MARTIGIVGIERKLKDIQDKTTDERLTKDEKLKLVNMEIEDLRKEIRTKHRKQAEEKNNEGE